MSEIHIHTCQCGNKFDCVETDDALCDVTCGLCSEPLRDLSDSARIRRGNLELQRRSRNEGRESND
jgi:hypothetical protein